MNPNAKQKLSFAIAGVVGASVHELAPVTASARDLQTGKTNPSSRSGRLANGSAGASPQIMTTPSSTSSPTRAAPSPAATVGASERQLAPVRASERDGQISKTNPPSLSARQLAAARLLASGLTLTDVAVQLQMSRGGLLKWRKQPAFLAEVRRMHEVMAYAAGAAAGEASRGAFRRVR